MESLGYMPYVCVYPGSILRLLKQPKLYVALVVALPAAILGGSLKYWQKYIEPGKFSGVIKEDACYGSVVLLVGFLCAFRIDAAYRKFWYACDYSYRLCGDLFNGTSAMLSFTRCSKAPKEEVDHFRHLLIRLVSLLNAVIIGELEIGVGREELADSEEIAKTPPNFWSLQLLDFDGISQEAQDELMRASNKPEMVFQWIQQIIVNAWNKGIFCVDSPIVSKAFKELADAMNQFHEAQKITEVPFPFPYQMALQLLLISHWIITPIVTVEWTASVPWAAIFSFAGVFSLWLFLGLAIELDQPFHATVNSVDMHYLQRLLNHRLLEVIDSINKPLPSLSQSVKRGVSRRTVSDISTGGIATVAVSRASVVGPTAEV